MTAREQSFQFYTRLIISIALSTGLLELLVLRISQRSTPHQGCLVIAKDVMLSPEHACNPVIGLWVSQLSCFVYKLHSLQLDMAEFACVNAIMLLEQGLLTATTYGIHAPCFLKRSALLWLLRRLTVATISLPQGWVHLLKGWLVNFNPGLFKGW